jgi:hypothetical protein
LEKTETSLNVFSIHATIYTVLELTDNDILLKLPRTHLGTALEKKE